MEITIYQIERCDDQNYWSAENVAWGFYPANYPTLAQAEAAIRDMIAIGAGSKNTLRIREVQA